MKKLFVVTILLVLLSLGLTSCSDEDDNQQVCRETNVTMIVNGEFQTFFAFRRGIDLWEDGYELQINLDRGIDEPFSEQGIAVILPYKKTGANIIEQFIYHQYRDGVLFDGDFLNGEFQSNVITNTNKCFYATFSGKLNNGTQEITITDGNLNFTYNQPFDW